jgi:hypothetical protein
MYATPLGKTCMAATWHILYVYQQTCTHTYTYALSTVAGACWDGGQRKLIIGSGNGSLTVHNFLQNTVIRTLPPCGAAISCIAYSTEDKVSFLHEVDVYTV